MVDSLNVCAAQHALVRYALGLVKMGKPYEEVVRRLARDVRRLHVISLVDTLDYVYEGGRLAPSDRIIGSLLRLKPIITADEAGKVRIIAKVRGQRNGFRMFTELVEEAGGIDFSLPVCMHYAGLSDGKMRDYIRQEAALFEKTPAHSRDFSRELAGQLLINIFISYMTNPHKYINLTACMERFRILCFPFGFLFL